MTHIELATEEDKAYGIDYWARLFKAKTWEDLKMIAKNNTVLTQASETLYTLNCDQTIRDMCRAREDAIRHENYMKRMLAEQEAALAAQAVSIAEQAASIAEKDASIAEKDAEIAEKDAEIARLKALLENNKQK